MDAQQTDVFTIVTDSEGAEMLENAARQLPEETRLQKRRVQAQSGDPNTWILVGQIAQAVLPTLGAALLMLIRQRRIKILSIGKDRFENITVDQYERVMKAHAMYGTVQPQATDDHG